MVGYGFECICANECLKYVCFKWWVNICLFIMMENKLGSQDVRDERGKKARMAISYGQRIHQASYERY